MEVDHLHQQLLTLTAHKAVWVPALVCSKAFCNYGWSINLNWFMANLATLRIKIWQIMIRQLKITECSTHTQLLLVSPGVLINISPLPRNFSRLILMNSSICLHSSSVSSLQKSMSMSWAGSCRTFCFCQKRFPGVSWMGLWLAGRSAKYALACIQ